MNRKARTGKIARLPKEVRERLNQHLEAGVPAPKLLSWLNSLPAVLEVLVRDFGGRPVSPQNLSEWRQGGFQDWLDLQERKARLRLLHEQAQDLRDAAGGSLTDSLAVLLSERYAELVEALSSPMDAANPLEHRRLRELSEEVTALRRLDHSAERLRIEHAQLALAKAAFQAAEEARKKRTDAEWRDWARQRTLERLRACGNSAEIQLAAYEQLFGPLEGQERENFLEKARNAEREGKGGAHDGVLGNPTKSGQIKP